MNVHLDNLYPNALFLLNFHNYQSLLIYIITFEFNLKAQIVGFVEVKITIFDMWVLKGA